MTTFTSSLPDQVLEKLNEIAITLKVPKNQIIERALTRYLEQIERQMYIRSYKNIASDEEIMSIAEEGLQSYNDELEKWDEKR
jgi:predicted transcriptional regulator